MEDISKARDLDNLTMDDLIGNLKTYELKKSQDGEMTNSRKEKNLALKATTVEEDNLALLTRRFQRIMK